MVSEKLDFKNIVMLTPGFPGSADDRNFIPALQDYVYDLGKAYPDLNIRIVSFKMPQKLVSYEWHGAEVKSFGNLSGKSLRLFRWINIWGYLKAIHEKNKIDFIHSFWLQECTLLGYLFCKFYKIPFLSSAMGQDVLPRNFFLRLLPLKNMKLTAPSINAANYLINRKLKVEVLPWGLGSYVFEMPMGQLHRNIDILGVGAAIPLKNYETFIRMVSELKKDFPDINTVVLGGGTELNSLRQMVVAMKLSDNVQFLGYVDRREVYQFMTKSKIFLHTSLFESQGYVLTEALHFGMATVSFKTGHMPPSEKSFQCENEAEMLQRLKLLLQTSQSFSSVPVMKMQETVAGFYNIYIKTIEICNSY